MTQEPKCEECPLAVVATAGAILVDLAYGVHGSPTREQLETAIVGLRDALNAAGRLGIKPEHFEALFSRGADKE